MADHVTIAIIHDTAINDLMAATGSISATLEIAPPVMPDFNNAAYQQAMRLRALADWLKTVNEALHPEPSLVSEGGDNGIPAKTKNPRSGGR
jgi:hypothetical protein